MITSVITSPSKPTGRERINLGVLGYMRGRNRARVYNLVVDEFLNSGISQAVLANRLGKAPEVISRWLGSPGNWTLDTESDLLYAISGAEPRYSLVYPHSEPPQNYRASWLNDNVSTFTPLAVFGDDALQQYVQPPHVAIANVGRTRHAYNST